MALTRPVVYFGLTMALLAASVAVLALPRGSKDVRLATPLETVPIDFKGWSGSNHVPADVLPVDPRVPAHLFRTYQNGTHTVWVSVGYYPFQAEGRRPPAQELLYPGRAWNERAAWAVQISVDEKRGQSIPANLLVLRASSLQVAILYWYQIQRRSVASDHWYRALLVYNRLIHGRSEGALVRIASPVPESVDPTAVVAKQTGFIRDFYPELVRRLPQ